MGSKGSMEDAAGHVKARKRKGRQRDATVRDRLEYAGLRVFVFVLRALPLAAAASLMGWLWAHFGRFSIRHRRALANLRIAFPEMDEAARRRIARQQWDNLGRTFAEGVQLDRIIDDPSRIELALGPALDKRMREPGGKVLASLHSANWEVAALPIRGYLRVAGLYQRITNPLVNAHVVALRAGVYGGGLLSKSPDTARRIIDWVRAGNAMAMLADHREARGIEVTSFARATLANPFPALVARRLGVPLVAARAVRLPGSRFRVEAVEIPITVTGDPRSDVHRATQAMQDQFDAWIRDRPGEWMWVQDRWGAKRRPRGRRRGRTGASCQTQPDAPISGK
jgi:Kdo2-lipid IVA lauroyltransferase/acyltransferase